MCVFCFWSGVDVALITDANTTSVEISFANGVNVKVTSVEDSLQFLLVFPFKYKAKTEGLLGTWNDNRDDDFLTPDNDTLPANSSLTEIHEFGQLCE